MVRKFINAGGDKMNYEYNWFDRYSDPQWVIKCLATPLSERCKNCLLSANIETIGDLCKTTEKQVSLIPGVGIKTINEIKAFALKCHVNIWGGMNK